MQVKDKVKTKVPFRECRNFILQVRKFLTPPLPPPHSAVLSPSILGLVFGCLTVQETLACCHYVSKTWRKVKACWHKLDLLDFAPRYTDAQRLVYCEQIFQASELAQVCDVFLVAHPDVLFLCALRVPNLRALRLAGQDATLGSILVFPRLRVLDLAQCGLVNSEELEYLCLLPELRELDLSNHSFRKQASRHLEKLSALEILHLLVGELDLDQIKFGNFSSLHWLALDGCLDTDLVHPTLIGALRQLEVRCDGISDAGVAHLKMLVSLTHLELTFAHRITDLGLGHLSGLSALQHLTFTGSRQVTDEGLKSLTGLVALQYLDLSFSRKLTGTGLIHLSQMQVLGTLYLFDCDKLTNLESMPLLPALKRLNLGECYNLTDASLSSLCACLALHWLLLPGCEEFKGERLQLVLTELSNARD